MGNTVLAMAGAPGVVRGGIGVYNELGAVLDAKFVSSYGLTGIGENPFLADQALSVGAPIWTPTIDAGVQWGKGIQLQGMPWEDYLAGTLPADSRLPPNFKTFDYYDEGSGLAVSAKTLNTMSDAKLANPGQVYSTLKTNIDAAANFETYALGDVELSSAGIAVRQVHVAVPFATTFDQYVQLGLQGQVLPFARPSIGVGFCL